MLSNTAIIPVGVMPTGISFVLEVQRIYAADRLIKVR